jgi:calcineurin-like phosphoesterase family protein
MPIIFSDLHLTEKTEEICFKVLDKIKELAVDSDRGVLFLGDWWSIRNQVSVALLNRVAEVLREWRSLGIRLELLPGNHDQIDINGRNALEIFCEYACVRTDPGYDPINFFGWVPYRKDFDKQRNVIKYIRKNASPRAVIFGHFGVAGALMNSGHRDEDGQKDLGMDDLVNQDLRNQRFILGHYHRYQCKGNYCYVGSPYQISYGEAGNNCGCLHLRIGGGIYSSDFIPLDVGAPKHYILKWNPQDGSPPIWPGSAADKVRIDVVLPQEHVVDGSIKKQISKAGLEKAEVRVTPTEIKKVHDFGISAGESLLSVGDRYVGERLRDAGIEEGTLGKADLMAALNKWASE